MAASFVVRVLGIGVLMMFSSVWVQSADVELQCPKTWTDGARTVLSCTIDDTKLTPTQCTTLTDTMDFTFTLSGTSVTTSQCQVTDYLTQCTASEPGLINNGQCKCHTPADGGIVFTFALLGDKTVHAGGSWNCSTTCRDSSLKDPLTYMVSSGCSPVAFDVCPAALEDDCQPVDCREHCNNAACACIIVFLGIVPVSAAAAIAVYCWRRQKSRKSKDEETSLSALPSAPDPQAANWTAEDSAAAPVAQQNPTPSSVVPQDPKPARAVQEVHKHYHIQNYHNYERAVVVTPDAMPTDGPLSFSQFPAANNLMRGNSLTSGPD